MRNGYPLVELHRHLDGNVRLGTILDLARQHGLPLPAWTEPELRPHAQVVEPTTDLLQFLAKLDLGRGVLADYAAVERLVRENLEDAVAEGIDYVELRFSPYFMAEPHGLDTLRVTETVCRSVAEHLPHLPLRAKLICIMSRTYGPEIAELELEAALRFRGHGIVGVDLAGDELHFPGELFVTHFRRAREAGLRRTVHAGEAAGPESVHQAVLELGAERIGHGIAARHDPALQDLLRERGIPLECCPTSNLQTRTVRGYSEHPLPQFLRSGLCVTLNTDDPGVSGITLADEYAVAERELGLTAAELRQLQENALAAAFLTDAERAELLAPV